MNGTAVNPKPVPTAATDLLHRPETVSTMPGQPVSDEEFTEMDEKISAHFDRVRERLAVELGGEPGDYEPDDVI